jgi:Co/Zn/Cd efflux system component
VLAAGIVMHVVIDLTIQIGIFSYAMFVLYLAWAPPDTVRTLPQKVRTRLRRGS